MHVFVKNLDSAAQNTPYVMMIQMHTILAMPPPQLKLEQVVLKITFILKVLEEARIVLWDLTDSVVQI